MKGLINFFLVVILIAAIALGGYFLFFGTGINSPFDDGSSGSVGTTTESDVVVYFKGEKVTDDIILSQGAENRFDIEYEDDVAKEYNLKVVPNVRFEYSVSGSATTLSESQDITGAFDIEKTKDCFIIKLTDGENSQTVLSRLYPDKKVNVVKKYRDSALPFWRVVITSKSGKVLYNINFGIGINVTGVTLPENLTF